MVTRAAAVYGDKQCELIHLNYHGPSRQMVRAFSAVGTSKLCHRRVMEGRSIPGPMAQLAALEASSRVAAVLGRSTTTMRKFNTNLVTHEIAFVVLRNALLRCLTSLKFLSNNRSL